MNRNKSHLQQYSPLIARPVVLYMHFRSGCIRCIGGHAYPKHLSVFIFILTFPGFRKGIAKTSLCAVDFSAVFPALGIQIIHITILAALTALLAAMPGVPDIMQEKSPLSHNKKGTR